MSQPFRLITMLDRYLVTQLLWIMLFAVVLFSVIWLAPETMFKLTQDVFEGQLSVGQALLMFAYHIPGVLQQTIPMAVLLGSIFLFQRLSQSYELVAMLASGISPARILMAVLWVGLLFGAVHVAVNELVIPHTAHRLEQLYTDAGLQDRADRNFLFVEKDHQDRLAKFFMIGQIQKPALSDFVVLYYEDNGPFGVRISRILRSKTGRWVPEKKQWELLDGIEYVLNDEGVYKDIRQFSEQQVRMDPFSATLLEYTKLNPMAMPWGQLKRYIELLDKGGQRQEIPYFQVRLWQKWTAPVATVLFALLGALLGMERVRTNRTYGLTFGALVIFIYSVMVPFTSSFGSLNLVAPWLVAWIPLLAAVGAAVLILALRPRHG